MRAVAKYRGLRVASVVCALTALLSALPAGAAPAEPLSSRTNRAESNIVSWINQDRIARGLLPLSAKSDLTSSARRQSVRMAHKQRLYHNRRVGREVHGWSSLGENVGADSDPAQAHQAFMESPPHSANILDSHFNQVGIGVTYSGGNYWITEVFVERYPCGSRCA